MQPAELPLSALLSQTLVAFTIEFDNESEHRLPHRTTNHGSTPGDGSKPWLGSMVMWLNCMRFVGDEGVRVGELEKLARTPTNLKGMARWGYIIVRPHPADKRPKPPARDWLILPTAGGRMARDISRPIFDEIEKRWEKRFGEEETGRLRQSLRALDAQFDVDLPDCLPILGYGLYSKGPNRAEKACALPPDLFLPSLLSRALLAFAMEFESESEVSLAISADVLRVLDEQGVTMRDIPVRSGVSKESISMAMGILRKKRFVELAKDRVVRLTPAGLAARSAYNRLVGELEERWRKRFGKETLDELRSVLEQLSGRLPEGLVPYPDGWRASVPKPETLPHFPMVLHRGGFPDGS